MAVSVGFLGCVSSPQTIINTSLRAPNNNFLSLQAVCKNRADKEEVPCTECGKLFPSRKQMSEHRRTRHRPHESLNIVPGGPGGPGGSGVPGGPGGPGGSLGQNMGHNLGQYFSSRPSTALPPFSHPAPLYHAPMQMTNEKLCQPDPSEARKQFRCDVCHAFFPSEPALEKHFSSHWQLETGQADLGQVKPLTGSDLSLAAHAQTSLEVSGVEENVGSLLRQVYNTEHIPEYHAQKMPHPHHHHMNDLFCDYHPPAFDNFLYYNA